jgi:hypothetical protein
LISYSLRGMTGKLPGHDMGEHRQVFGVVPLSQTLQFSRKARKGRQGLQGISRLCVLGDLGVKIPGLRARDGGVRHDGVRMAVRRGAARSLTPRAAR